MLILNFRINRNWADTGNRRAFIETVAAYDSAILFGNNTIEAGVRKHHGKYAYRHLD
jgi:hypothetical protein